MDVGDYFHIRIYKAESSSDAAMITRAYETFVAIQTCMLLPYALAKIGL